MSMVEGKKWPDRKEQRARSKEVKQRRQQEKGGGLLGINNHFGVADPTPYRADRWNHPDLMWYVR